MLKKFTAIALLLLILISVHSVVFAVSAADVYAETVTATSDKTVLIPVKIKNNAGVMGFKITVSYDKTVLTSPKVTKGDLVENGMMNDSVGVSQDGTFDVVWTGSQNISGDGTLMVLSFTPVEAKDTQIKLGYSQADTFNESWEDVELKCSDITVRFSSEKVTEQATEKNETVKPIQPATNAQSAKPENSASSEEIKNAVDIVLGEANKGSLDEIPEVEKEEFIDRTNEVLGTLTGDNDKSFENIEEIKGAYNEAVGEKFIEDTKDAVDSSKIEAAIKDSLESVGAESVEQIPAEKKEEYVQKVESNIAQYAPDADKISDKLEAEEAVEIIQQLQSENAEAATEGKQVPKPENKNNSATIIAVVCAILFAAVIAVAVVYRKRKKNEEAK